MHEQSGRGMDMVKDVFFEGPASQVRFSRLLIAQLLIISEWKANLLLLV
jgi:hypothetical protein